jgi:hypothetical protein
MSSEKIYGVISNTYTASGGNASRNFFLTHYNTRLNRAESHSARTTAGDAIGDVTGGFTGFFLGALALDNKGLAEVREVEIVIEFGRGPDFAGFDSAVIRGVGKDKIRAAAVVKK